MSNERNGKIALGCGLIAVALLPTPDDITIVSPLAQLGAGTFFIISGLMEKK